MEYKCSVCGRPATVAVKEINNGTTTVRYYCDECSPMQGAPTMSKLLASMFGQPTARRRSMRVCKCGMTEKDVLNSGKFGCAECYDTFRDIAENYARSRGYHEHVGKSPKGARKPDRQLSEVEKLQAELEQAVANRDWQRASELDKQIQQLNGKKEG